MSLLKYFWEKIFLTVPVTFYVLTQDQYSVLWGLTAVITIDTFLGILVAVRHKVFASYKLRRISNKIVNYACLLFLIHILGCVEPTFVFAFRYMGIFLILTEIFSSLEKLSILGVELPTKILAMLNDDFKDYYFGDNDQSSEALKRILNKEQASCRKDRIPITILNSNIKEI